MENTKYGRRREGRWTPIPAKAQDTKANLNSWGTHLVRKRWDIGLIRALSLWIMMMMMISQNKSPLTINRLTLINICVIRKASLTNKDPGNNYFTHHCR